ncbi:hypothetical protein MRX96_018860 [Rhipicephalus microplus]
MPAIAKRPKRRLPHPPCSNLLKINDNQVKIYTDNNTGNMRSPMGNAYNKMSQGLVDHSDIDAFEATQSRDCEPSPPQPLHHGSKTNFFSPTGSGFLPGDAAALQHPVPPKQPRWCPCKQHPAAASALAAEPVSHASAQPHQSNGRLAAASSALAVAWCCTTPSGQHRHPQAAVCRRAGSVGGGGGTPPQGSGSKGSVLEGTHYSGRGAAPRRPMSFVKALEMTDSIEKGSSGSRPQRNADGTASASGERRSVYDMNYEISV